jgi:hypothetical protein
MSKTPFILVSPRKVIADFDCIFKKTQSTLTRHRYVVALLLSKIVCF